MSHCLNSGWSCASAKSILNDGEEGDEDEQGGRMEYMVIIDRILEGIMTCRQNNFSAVALDVAKSETDRGSKQGSSSGRV